MIGTLQCTVLDCSEPAELARFYAALLGGEIDRPDRRWATDEGWSTLHVPDGSVLCFQRIPDYRPPRWPDPAHPPQLHLDIGVPDLDAAESVLLAAGGRLLSGGDGTQPWRVYADPAGHVLCLVREAPAT
ncbi:VOC family protein [Streptomyces sp. NPDC050418]|uniref:VOC family protein n=1 Tax=Streptomyces sp. NPDC050418 TaxID=3365612 RepID=UPI0037B2BB46